MADDHIQRPPETRVPGPTPADHATTATPPGPPAPAPRLEAAAANGSEGEAFGRWAAGLAIVLAAGWGFIAVVAWLTYRYQERMSVLPIAMIAAVVSLGFFLLLERNRWLSNFMGLRPAPNASPYKDAFFLWLLGVPGLLWRSTEGRDAAASPVGDQKVQSDVSNTREVIETVVFVVVLVLLLKSFVAEAFVIPTGSMATTLYGYQKTVKCPKCGHEFPVNCSQEVDPQEGERVVITGCTCPNCRFHVELAKEQQVNVRDPHSNQLFVRTEWVPTEEGKGYNTGDRVLVGKFLYDLPWTDPEKYRLNVVVFKYPEKPQKDFTPMNYIKRLIGLSEETIAIYYGKIYVLRKEKGLRFDDSDVPELDRWKPQYMHVDDPRAMDRWDKNEFEILRNPPDVVLAKRRLVYDLDHPATDVKERRWQGGGGWSEDGAAHTFKHAAGGGVDWLHYRHIIGRDGRTRPELITDFMGYNSYEPQPGPQANHWVGDLMLDCDVTIDKPEGELIFELSRGRDRFRAVFDLASGECSLRQLKKNTDEAPDLGAGEEFAKKPTALKKSGTYHVRFANVDDRLLVWVDRDLPFGEAGAAYTVPLKGRGPTEQNDLWPASIGVKGAGATVGHLQLWRDTYYTQMTRGGGDEYPTVNLANPSEYPALQDLKPMTLYVQAGHYLCLGDNSPHSSDGRVWGLVPDRLMLGRALVVYYPFPPLGNRAGPIH